MRKMKIIIFLYIMLWVLMTFEKIPSYAMDSEGNVVVVLDPGHGGVSGESDDGASYNGVTERFINLTVANAAKQELEKYDNIKVYMTRTSPDERVSLRERAEFAESVQADFVFSLHFNASENHGKYGAEVWIPSIGQYYVKGYQFADISTRELEKMGLWNRGIKTRVGEGEDEYYGIIRECENRGIPAVIIEHCYVDNLHDFDYFDVEEDLVEFGKTDANAIAKYFRLKSNENDYGNQELAQVEEPTERVYHDMSQPEICEVTLNQKETKKGILSFDILGKDKDSRILYYDYSLDGGVTYSDLFEWQDMDNDDMLTVMVSNISIDKGMLVVRIYNQYDIPTESNHVEIDMQQYTQDNKLTQSNQSDDGEQGNRITKHPSNNMEKYQIVMAVLLVLGGIGITAVIIKKM